MESTRVSLAPNTTYVARSRPDKRRLGGALAAALGCAWASILIFHVGSSLTRQWFSNLSLCAMPLIAALFCFWRAWRESGRARRPWIFLGAAAFSWSCGQMIWTYYESFNGREV